MGMTLPQFIAKLDTYSERVPLDELETLLREVEVTVDTVRDFLTFSPGHYTRNPIALGPAYQALVLCWLPGQESVIHDHKGSSCAVRVLEGECTEVAYRWNGDGTLAEGAACTLPPDAICGTQDSDIHKICNFNPGNLITLHVYSPPLEVMNTYRVTGECVGEVHVPASGPHGSAALTGFHMPSR
jgi:cysteine dioxygenase